ncbi:endonuclease [Bacillus aquiflavi]|uniref:endonuclease n=1 Tax=Bacillus aquiflavi TaxID=2672567 RepID=UPI001CA7B703|nr:endonuclease [Bacillus aquiflavi]UAC49604.1 endonuclease [Bacillus aquiflavi]
MRQKASFLFKLLLVAILSFGVLPSFIFDTNVVNAEGPLDPAPQITPANPNGMSVLFDNTHGQTAGAADWVIDGAFSDFANEIAKEGFFVKELRKATPITYEDLKDYEVFVIPEANIPYKKSEQDAMIQYVENGGSIFFISDHYNADRNKNRWDSSEVMNGYRRGAFTDPAKGMSAGEKASEAMQGIVSSDWLADNFGIRFRYNAVGDVNARTVAPANETFGITNGVNSVAMHAGSTLMIIDPKKAKGLVYLPTGLTENEAWGPAVDQGVYFGGGIEEGPYAAISKLGNGKAAFIGDSSPVEDATPKYLREENGQKKRTYDGFKEQDDAILLMNIIHWLADKETYTNFEEAGIPLDAPSPVLDMEIPENSTEPKPEPWAAPTPGYKWYDPSTFAPGSYGSVKQAEIEPEYSFVHQDVLPNAEEFQIRLVVDNMNPGQTVSDLRVGIYLEGGTQVAKFQNEDGTWPASYGYSQPISVTADQSGRATKDLTVQIKSETTGSASLRLKQGKQNLITNTVTIDHVPSVPLPDDSQNVPGEISIADARQKTEGTVVTVQGVITSEPGVFGGKGFYIQDETAGIYVYQHDEGYQVGDVVKITAPTKLFNNEFELENIVAINKVGTSDRPEAKIVSEVNETNQGQLVRLENVTIENLKEVNRAFEFDIAGEGTATRVRVDGRTGITHEQFSANFKNGDNIHLSGVASIFKDTFQLKLLRLNDVELAEVKDTESPIIHDLVKEFFFLTDLYEQMINVTDEGSGVEEINITLNGKELTNPIKIEPLQLRAGTHTLTVTAKDAAGNKSERTFNIEVMMDIDHLDELLEIGLDKKYITNRGIYNSFLHQIIGIQNEKNNKSQKYRLFALHCQVGVLSGKLIDKDYAQHWYFKAA